MSDLNVIDVSAVVHTGMNCEHYKNMSYYGYPTGGIYYLMMYVCNSLMLHDDVILCFDSPTFRKQLQTDYKDGRQKNPVILSQIETVYTELNKCGFKCEKVDGYEADDIIHWVANDLSEQYYLVNVLGNDMDLCHEVRNNVRFQSTRKDQNSITMSNFSTCVKKGVFIPYNTISAYKTLCGCHSDNVNAFHAENGKSGKYFFDLFIKFLEQFGYLNNYAATTNPKVFEVWANHCSDLTCSDLDELKRRIQIIYPAEKPFSMEFVPTTHKTIDKYQFSRFLSLFNISDAFKSSIFRRIDLDEEDKQWLRSLSNSLKTGEFMADKNLSALSNSRVSSQILKLDVFSKDY